MVEESEVELADLLFIVVEKPLGPGSSDSDVPIHLAYKPMWFWMISQGQAGFLVTSIP